MLLRHNLLDLVRRNTHRGLNKEVMSIINLSYKLEGLFTHSD